MAAKLDFGVQARERKESSGLRMAGGPAGSWHSAVRVKVRRLVPALREPRRALWEDQGPKGVLLQPEVLMLSGSLSSMLFSKDDKGAPRGGSHL